MAASPSEQPTNIRDRLTAAAVATRAKRDAYNAERELRDHVIAAAINDEGLSWRAVQRLTKLTPNSISDVLAKAASRASADAQTG